MSTIKLPDAIFGETLRSDIIYRCLRHRVIQRRNQNGIRPTKTVTTISGSGKKPRPQKGGGQARMGKKRSNITNRGEKAHGRYARDISIGNVLFSFLFLILLLIIFILDMNAKVLRFGMRSALAAKYALGQIVVIDHLGVPSGKTKDFAALVRQNGWGDRVLFLDTQISPDLRQASHAVPSVFVTTIYRANIWDILKQKLIVMTPQVVDEIERIYHPLESVRKAGKKEKQQLEEQHLEEQHKE